MPELPEVETVRAGLQRYLVGHKITKLRLRRKNLRFPFPEDFEALVQDRKVVAVERRAKYLLIRLSGDQTLLGHLGMSGSFVFVDDPQYQPRTHDHVLFSLSNGTTMVYNDPRRFGVLDVVATPATEAHRLLNHLGPEPLSEHWTPEAFAAAIRAKSTPIKVALLDQRVVVGVGNIYACEALFMSNISPRRKAGGVAGAKRAGKRAERLVDSVKSVLSTAIEAGGSTLKDFQNVDGEAGYFAHQFQVYDREGEACVRASCDGLISRIVQGGRSTFFCPACQR